MNAHTSGCCIYVLPIIRYSIIIVLEQKGKWLKLFSYLNIAKTTLQTSWSLQTYLGILQSVIINYLRTAGMLTSMINKAWPL